MAKEHRVPLDRLPDRLVFPAELTDRIGYDEARKQLWFRGFMSKALFDRLCALSDDWDFHAALEQLFLLGTPETATTPHASRPGLLRWLIGR